MAGAVTLILFLVSFTVVGGGGSGKRCPTVVGAIIIKIPRLATSAPITLTANIKLCGAFVLEVRSFPYKLQKIST